jgi:hypothetical protein
MEIYNVYKDGDHPEALYIGRGKDSPLGNPWVIGKHGTREEVIYLYREYLKNKILSKDPIILEVFRNITKETNLLCWMFY